jgi:cell fate regulator YaaT (PSP1 superfamily)
VSATGELVRLQMKKKGIEAGESIKKIYRKAKVQDIEKWREAQDLETPTMYKARTFAIQHGLQMKISDVEYQGDKSKAIFYYTAEGRVDFRELIKTLAEQFRVRIEMRQIGSRQEAARLGGIGSCGRELCCSTWLSDFRTVSTSAARYQQLSLNPLKLAGQCGKLKCCLNYELDSYLDAIKDIPEIENRRLKTKSGSAVLQKTDIFRKIMWFSYEDKLDVFIPLDVARVKEVLEMNRNGAFPEELSIHKKEVGKPIVKEPDFENVVGQDSITRFDKNKGGKSQGHRNKFKGGNPQNPSKNPSNPQNSNDRNKQSAGKNFRRNSNNGNPNRGNPNRGNSNKPNNS